MKPRRPPQASILASLPAELRREASPARCLCLGCVPSLTRAQRAAKERAEQAWRAARQAWCRANGYLLADLLVAERPRPVPHQKRAATADTTT